MQLSSVMEPLLRSSAAAWHVCCVWEKGPSISACPATFCFPGACSAGCGGRGLRVAHQHVLAGAV
jgi:hypothetical protein